eukprot:TRINITY_DN9341_c0_g1_i1.p2 TRINITY_DN9341_c0_g1~~TRINITY_DN9341_c0_g1_i1.p2  ORF type:complete len:106 (+),score=5.28 TRINITY_DN9341_c0_g1_i1:100-417(+)
MCDSTHESSSSEPHSSYCPAGATSPKSGFQNVEFCTVLPRIVSITLCAITIQCEASRDVGPIEASTAPSCLHSPNCSCENPNKEHKPRITQALSLIHISEPTRPY